MEDAPKPTRSNPEKSASHKLRSETQLRADAARSETMRGIWANPEVHKRMSEANKRAWNPERRNRKSEAMKLIWADPKVHQRWSEANKRTAADPEVRKRMSEANKRTAADPEVRKRKSKASKRTWKNPAVRKRRIEGIKRAAANPEVQKRVSEGNLRAWANPERRKRTSERNKRDWKNPAVRKRRIKGQKRAFAKPELKKRRSEASKKVWAERRSKLAAAWRPADWDDKPIEWRIIATELFSKSTMSNRELGKRLDRSRLIKCPYGASWEMAINKPGPAANFEWRVRKWLNRPGQKIA